MRVLHVVVLGSVLLFASVGTRAQAPRVAEEPGVSGYVLGPDGTPLSSGSVAMQSLGVRATASTSIDRTGRFRLVPSLAGLHHLSVSVSGFARYRVSVTVPQSRRLNLPVIRLSALTHFRARFVSPAGDPIAFPRLRRRSVDASGIPIPDPPPEDRVDHIDSEGTLTLGPLPRGITMLALDMPLLAQTRLPDLLVTGAQPLLEGGTVIVQPGAVLHVDVVDETGAPMPRHKVSIEDVLSPSPLFFLPALTDQQGRVTFDQLGEGRYRLLTWAAGFCGNRPPLMVARVVPVPGSGTLLTRLVVGGHATFRVASAAGPSRGTVVAASPDAGPSSPPAWLRSRSDFTPTFGPMGPVRSQPPCTGTTGADGRVTLTTFPPGPARVDVQLPNSKYVRRVNVPDDGGEVAIVVPDGFLPLRVTDALKNQPVAAAAITWTGGGARVEATATANGEALLEAVGTAPGILTITARGYQPAEGKFAEPPAVLQEVALVPAAVTTLRPRVITTSGEPVPGAVVELSPENPFEEGQVAVADKEGFVIFSDAPPGALRLMASAEGLAAAAMRISEDRRSGIVLTLTRGYRVIASVEFSAEAGPHLVRVVNETVASMEGLLDIASDRRIEPPGRLSLGPLAPGTYVIELRGSGEPRQARIRIVDRDVDATFR